MEIIFVGIFVSVLVYLIGMEGLRQWAYEEDPRPECPNQMVNRSEAGEKYECSQSYRKWESRLSEFESLECSACEYSKTHKCWLK